MVDIPRKMSNEESRLYAAIVCEERVRAIANAKLFGYYNRLNKKYPAIY